HVRGADAGLPDHRERVVLLQEQLAAGVETEPAPAAGAVEQFAGARHPPPPPPVPRALPPRRPPSPPSGGPSRSGLLLACQPNRSFGSSRPRLTRSTARPRTPTIVPSRTAMSIASTLEWR